MDRHEHLIWKALSSRRILDTPIFTVNEEEALGPDGRRSSFIIVDAPDWGIILPVLVREGEERFLMVRQFRHGAGAMSLEFPGGVIERGEDPAAGAARELLEETGYRAGRVEPLGSVFPNPAFQRNRCHVFLARELELVGDQRLDENEFVDVEEVPVREALASAGNPPFIHSLMVMSIVLYERRVRADG